MVVGVGRKPEARLSALSSTVSRRPLRGYAGLKGFPDAFEIVTARYLSTGRIRYFPAYLLLTRRDSQQPAETSPMRVDRAPCGAPDAPPASPTTYSGREAGAIRKPPSLEVDEGSL